MPDNDTKSVSHYEPRTHVPSSGQALMGHKYILLSKSSSQTNNPIKKKKATVILQPGAQIALHGTLKGSKSKNETI